MREASRVYSEKIKTFTAEMSAPVPGPLARRGPPSVAVRSSRCARKHGRRLLARHPGQRHFPRDRRLRALAAGALPRLR